MARGVNYVPAKLGTQDCTTGTSYWAGLGMSCCATCQFGMEAAYLGRSLPGSKILSFPFHWMCGTGSPSAWHWNMAVWPWYTVVGSGSSLKVT